ncbi:Fc.00g032800.m01.CDS01 [Cosmosporella sp. VM-42]
MSTSTSSEPYFSVSTIKVKPDKVQEAYQCFEEVTKATMEKESGAKMYRVYKVEGKDEFVWIEKFESREAYAAHVQSEHVQGWAKKYLSAGLFDGTFEFYPLSKEGPGAGGFDRP